MTQVEKKAQPYLPFIPISGNSPHRKSTIELHGTATDLTMASRQCGVHPLAQVGHNHTPSQNPAIYSYYALFLAPAKLTFHSSRHSFADSIHFFFGLPASRFPTHSPLYTHLTNRLSSILSTLPNHLNVLSFILSFTPFFTSHNPLIRLSLIHISEPTRLL